MANNVLVDEGADRSIATDEVAGVSYQLGKLVDGTEDSTTRIAAGSGVEAAALRVTLATDSTGQVKLTTGTASIGKLAANSGVDIGDVDVTSVPADPFGLNADAVVAAGATGSIQAKLRRLTTDIDAIKTSVAAATPAGTNNIGDVDVLTMPTVTVSSHAVTNVGVFATQVDGAALTALQLIDDPVLVDDVGFTPGTSKVNVIGLQADETSPDSVDEGDAGAPRMTLDRITLTTQRPSATGEGLDIFRSLDLDETEEDIKTSAGKVYGWFMSNASTSPRFIKFYNATAASVTVGSTPPALTVYLPPTSASNVEYTNGIKFSTAISAAATTLVADSDATAPTNNDVVANIFYK